MHFLTFVILCKYNASNIKECSERIRRINLSAAEKLSEKDEELEKIKLDISELRNNKDSYISELETKFNQIMKEKDWHIGELKSKGKASSQKSHSLLLFKRKTHLFVLFNVSFSNRM